MAADMDASADVDVDGDSCCPCDIDITREELETREMRAALVRR